MSNPESSEILDLEIDSIIGFDGLTLNGLKVHPDKIHVVYPLGNKVCIQNWKTKSQAFLTGHTNVISAVDISPNGKYVGSGQINYMGFKSSVILWDFQTQKILAKHEIHKVRVEAVTFSCNSAYLMSLGGRDDCNIVVWDVEKSEAICGNVASTGTAGDALILCPTSRRGPCFISAGEDTLRVWRLNPMKRNVTALDVKFGMVKRHLICCVVDVQDEYAFCGSTTGDIIKIKLNYDYDPLVLDPIMPPVLVGCYGKYAKKKSYTNDHIERYSKGVTALALLPDDFLNRFVVAAGDGTVELVKERPMKPMDTTSKPTLRTPSMPQIEALKRTNVDSGATSLHIMGEEIIAGTVKCEIYTINIETFDVILHVTCHTHSIFDIAYPYDFPEVFATCSKNDIRVWNSDTCKELLRISVPNFTCSSITFSHDGKSIVSGWNDGIIRAFTPQTGRLMYAIHNAHSKGVSALKITTCDKMLISGGVEGEVRIWEIKPTFQTLVAILKEHKAPVTSISICEKDSEAVSASTDGTCIIWDLIRKVRSQVLFANTQFMCAAFFPSAVQILTTGTDRKIGYWEVFDGSLIRELEGSTCAALNTLAISSDGSVFVTGGCDQYVKFWNYKEGVMTHIGVGHAAIVTSVCFSPDDRHIMSVSADGGIFRWKCPTETKDDMSDTISTITSIASSRSSCSMREHMWNKAAARKLPNDNEENIRLSREGMPKSQGSKMGEQSGRKSAESICSIKSQGSIRSVISSKSTRSCESLPANPKTENQKSKSEENVRSKGNVGGKITSKNGSKSHMSSRGSVQSHILSAEKQNGRGDDKDECICRENKTPQKKNINRKN